MGGFEEFEPLFNEPRIEWSKNSNPGSGLMGQFLMHIFAPDYNHLKIKATNYHSNTFEDAKSVMQLDGLKIGQQLGKASMLSSYLYNPGLKAGDHQHITILESKV
uniref:Uncharacterized protein n=1 Tax=Salix viminalis TaxID=40686 RepID=A0A6N2NE12_SALVM